MSREPLSSETRCECVCRYGIPCRRPAKWQTPQNKRHTGGWKVCGQHKHRFETLTEKATPL